MGAPLLPPGPLLPSPSPRLPAPPPCRPEEPSSSGHLETGVESWETGGAPVSAALDAAAVEPGGGAGAGGDAGVHAAPGTHLRVHHGAPRLHPLGRQGGPAGLTLVPRARGKEPVNGGSTAPLSTLSSLLTEPSLASWSSLSREGSVQTTVTLLRFF